jgi:hypothetical protein
MITAGARLLLAMLEVEVTRRDGAYAFCETDSMAVIATKLGGLFPCEGGPEVDEHGRASVRALSHAQRREIIAGFQRLNPYTKKVIPGSILEIDDVSLDADGEIRDLWAWPIAAKRYATFTWHHGRPVLADKYSEHGLGHLADPRPLGQRYRPPAADGPHCSLRVCRLSSERSAREHVFSVDGSPRRRGGHRHGRGAQVGR